jgi:hypothetical protein
MTAALTASEPTRSSVVNFMKGGRGGERLGWVYARVKLGVSFSITYDIKSVILWDALGNWLGGVVGERHGG